MKHLISVLIILLFSLPVSAYDKGEDLLWACSGDMKRKPKFALEKMHCVGYITGLYDGMQLVFSARPESRFICPPRVDISADQKVRIVTRWLEDNPADLHKSAKMSVFIAFGQAFPCN